MNETRKFLTEDTRPRTRGAMTVAAAVFIAALTPVEARAQTNSGFGGFVRDTATDVALCAGGRILTEAITGREPRRNRTDRCIERRADRRQDARDDRRDALQEIDEEAQEACTRATRAAVDFRASGDRVEFTGDLARIDGDFRETIRDNQAAIGREATTVRLGAVEAWIRQCATGSTRYDDIELPPIS